MMIGKKIDQKHEFGRNNLLSSEFTKVQIIAEVRIFDHEFTLLSLPAQDPPSTTTYQIQQQPQKQYKIPSFVKQEAFRDLLGRRVVHSPVITFFGKDPRNRSTALHIHGFFPYFYIKVHKYRDLFKSKTALLEFARQLETAFYGCYPTYRPMNVSRAMIGGVYSGKRRDSGGGEKLPILYNLSLVKAIDFYGYHSEPQCFLKVEVYDDKVRKKLAKILENGIVCGINFQPFEVHLSVFMHFYSDCNLHGFIALRTKRWYRRVNQASIPDQVFFQKYDIDDRNYNFRKSAKLGHFEEESSPQSCLMRQTMCEIEIDAYYKDLENYINFKNEKSKECHFSKFSYSGEKFRKTQPLDGQDKGREGPKLSFFGETDSGRKNNPFFNLSQSGRSRASQNPFRLSIPAQSRAVSASKGSNQLKKWELKITKILQNIWKDEAERRRNHNLDDNMDWYIDVSQNIDSEIDQIAKSQSSLKSPKNPFLRQSQPSNIPTIHLEAENDALEHQSLDLLQFTNQISEPKKFDSLYKKVRYSLSRHPIQHIKSTKTFINYGKPHIPLDTQKIKVYKKLLKNEKIEAGESLRHRFGQYYQRKKQAKLDQVAMEDLDAEDEGVDLYELDSIMEANKSYVKALYAKDLAKPRQKKLNFRSMTSGPLGMIAEERRSSAMIFEDDGRRRRFEWKNSLLGMKRRPPSAEKVNNEIIMSNRQHLYQYPFFGNFDDLLFHYRGEIHIKAEELGLLKGQNHYNQAIFIHENFTQRICKNKPDVKILSIKESRKLPEATRYLHKVDSKPSSLSEIQKNSKFSHKFLYKVRRSPPPPSQIKHEIEALEGHQTIHQATPMKTLKNHNSQQRHKFGGDDDCIDQDFNFRAPKINHAAPRISTSGFKTIQTQNKRKSILRKIKKKADNFEQRRLKEGANGYEESQETPETPVFQSIDTEDVKSFSFEIFAKTSNPTKKANPELDSINFILYSISSERLKILKSNESQGIGTQNSTKNKNFFSGLLLCADNDPQFEELRQYEHDLSTYLKFDQSDEIVVVKNELSLILFFIHLTQFLDPDIVFNYNCDRGSLFYLVFRARRYGLNCQNLLSRHPKKLLDLIEYKYTPEDVIVYSRSTNILKKLTEKLIFVGEQLVNSKPLKGRKGHQRKLKGFGYEVGITGRVVLNVWRLARHELKLTSYTMNYVYESLFEKKASILSDSVLTELYKHSLHTRTDVFAYVFKRLRMSTQILDKMGIIPKTIEMSKVYAVEFHSVLCRGSQFRIEAAISRVSKANGFLLLSATQKQVSEQPILQCQALLLEPPKQFFVDPVVVVDFQSLYPSIMISHNLCFSTCLGRIDEKIANLLTRVGVAKTDIDFSFLLNELNDPKNDQTGLHNHPDRGHRPQEPPNDSKIKKSIYIAPNNVAYVTSHIRRGIVPQILEEFLQTRIMIKKSKKLYKSPQIQKILEGRQMAIKLFMNVMYGYTGASVHGRMPCCDIADSTVEIGKFILKKCIKLIEKSSAWRGKVIYGDTDSLFILLPGRSVEQANTIGYEICAEITKKLPFPMALKFEKVLCPFAGFSKKRYIGWKLETKSERGSLLSKGIEVSRRDGCPALVKIFRNCIDRVFHERDLSILRLYLERVWLKVMEGDINAKDFVFAKEVKLGSYKMIPAAGYAGLRLGDLDPMLEPAYKERVKYLVLKGTESDKVKDLVVPVGEYLSRYKYSLNVDYYLGNVLNKPLGRFLGTFDVDLKRWFASIDFRKLKKKFLTNFSVFGGKSAFLGGSQTMQNMTMNGMVLQKVCLVCQKSSLSSICENCFFDAESLVLVIESRKRWVRGRVRRLEEVCRRCCDEIRVGDLEEIDCLNYDCEVVFSKDKARDMAAVVTEQCDDALLKLNFAKRLKMKLEFEDSGNSSSNPEK